MYKHLDSVHNSKSADIILPIVFRFFKPKSILDIGCGTGTWLASAKRLGVQNVLGIDSAYVKKAQLKIEPSEFITEDLNNTINLNKQFDLAISLEVAEHILPNRADNFIETLTCHSDNILFSAALKGQGGQNHLNEQGFDYWAKKFNTRGYHVYDVIRPFIWDNNDVDWWYSQNCFLLSKNNLDEIIKTIAIPKIQNIIHPSLYNYRIENIKGFQRKLNLKIDILDNYKLILPNKFDVLKMLFRKLKKD